MMGIIITILLVVGLFKLTGLFFRICGKLIGAMFSIFGYLLIAGLAVGVFGLAVVAIPIILIVGIGSLAAASASV